MKPFARRLFLVALVLALIPAGLLVYRNRAKSDPQQLLEAGQTALRQGDVATADQMAARLHSGHHPEHAALLRGEKNYRLRKFKLAEEELVLVQGTSDLYPQAASLFALCRLESGDIVFAEQLLRGILEKAPESIDAHRGLAEVYFTLGANSKVIDELEIVARIDPTDTRPWLFKAGFYSDVGLFAESIDAYEEALKRCKTPERIAEARFGLAESLMKFGQHSRVLEVLNELPESYRSDPRALTLRADALLRTGNLQEAEKTITPLLMDKTSNSGVLTIAGKIAIEAGHYEQAVQYLEKAAADPSYYEAHYHLAQALARLGKTQESATCQKRADQIKADLQQMSQLVDVAGMLPWDASVREKLAVISARLGKTDIAEKWAKAAKMCPPPPKS